MKNLRYKTKQGILLLLLVLLTMSCSKKSKIESIIIANNNEYWAFNNYCLDIKGVYFHFNKNGSTNKYYLHVDDGFSLYDDQGKPVLWALKNDSTFVYNYLEYKLEKISKEEILLSYYKSKDKKCFVKLSKWVDGSEGPKPLKLEKDK